MNESFLLVSIGERRRLVRLSEVQEILSLMALTPTDEATGNCRGLLNLRGETLPVFDTGGPAAVLSPSRFILITRVDDSPVGLIIDEVHDVLAIEKDSIKVRSLGSGKMAQVATLGNEILTVLEAKKVVNPELL